MPAKPNRPKADSQKYEIGEPKSYTAYPLDPAQRQPAAYRHRWNRGLSRRSRDWIDSEKSALKPDGECKERRP